MEANSSYLKSMLERFEHSPEFFRSLLRDLDQVLSAGDVELVRTMITDVANSGIPVKVGMALTAHKSVAMFMRYVYTEYKPVREAAKLVAKRCKTITGMQLAKEVVA